MKKNAKSLLEKKMENAEYRKRHEEQYEDFKLEVQLLNAMEKKHMTYAELAKRLHTHKSNISRDLVGGGIKNATIARIKKMSSVLGIKFLPLLITTEQAKTLLPKIKKMMMT